jgi:preprotein translocase subunit SecE
MARDRQRAKQRQQQRREQRLKERREQAAGRTDGAPTDGAPADGAPADGADPADPAEVGRLAAETGAPPQNVGRSDASAEAPPPELRDDEEIEELFLDEEDEQPDEEELAEAEAEVAREEGYEPRGRRGRAERPATGAPTPSGGGARVVHFLRASWAELQRVQWPDRRALTQLTAIVLVFIVIMGTYLGVLDAIVSRIIKEII